MLEKPEKKSIILPDNISCSVTWCDGRCIFKEDTRFGQFYYGICSYSKRIWAITPLDYEKATMITTINVAPISKVCDRGKVCFDFKCPLNNFKKKAYVEEFAGMGEFTLGLPKNIEKVDEIWFNAGEYKNFWKNFIIPYSGGVLKYSEEKRNS